MTAYTAQHVELEVVKDGTVRVRRVVCAVDCGLVADTDTARESVVIFVSTAALWRDYGEERACGAAQLR